MDEPGRLLVTGANGSLGMRLLRTLAGGSAAAFTPRALVRSERAAAVVRSLAIEPSPEVFVADYADAGSVARAASGCSSVVHLVGILKETRRARYQDAHEATCEVIAQVAGQAGLRRAVYVSVLGADPAEPNACLASKGRAERILLQSGVATTVLRVPMVLGDDDAATRALRAQAGAGLVPLLRGGACFEQPIDAADVIAAVVAALGRPELAGSVLELAGPESLPHRELVRRAAAMLGRRPRILPVPLAAARLFAALAARWLADPPLTPPMLDVLERDDRIDPTPACQRLGIRLTPLDETLKRCVGAATTPH